MSKPVMKVNCPTCKRKFEYYSSEFRPFCSDKCKMADMGHWFNDSYTIDGRSNTVYIEDSELLKKLTEEPDENY